MSSRYHHGYLSSRLEAALLEDTAKTLGIRLLTFDRCGYGRSDPNPRRDPASAANDSQLVLEAAVAPDEKIVFMGASGQSFVEGWVSCVGIKPAIVPSAHPTTSSTMVQHRRTPLIAV
jgi:hypothetical protein